MSSNVHNIWIHSLQAAIRTQSPRPTFFAFLKIVRTTLLSPPPYNGLESFGLRIDILCLVQGHGLKARQDDIFRVGIYDIRVPERLVLSPVKLASEIA